MRTNFIYQPELVCEANGMKEQYAWIMRLFLINETTLCLCLILN